MNNFSSISGMSCGIPQALVSQKENPSEDSDDEDLDFSSYQNIERDETRGDRDFCTSQFSSIEEDDPESTLSELERAFSKTVTLRDKVSVNDETGNRKEKETFQPNFVKQFSPSREQRIFSLSNKASPCSFSHLPSIDETEEDSELQMLNCDLQKQTSVSQISSLSPYIFDLKTHSVTPVDSKKDFQDLKIHCSGNQKQKSTNGRSGSRKKIYSVLSNTTKIVTPVECLISQKKIKRDFFEFQEEHSLLEMGNSQKK